jgi:hypothetical protein
MMCCFSRIREAKLGYSGHAVASIFDRHTSLSQALHAINLSLSVEIYLSPIETHCSNIDYFPTIENGGETEESTRLHLARGVIALFILSFFSVVCAFFTGLSGE